MNRADIARNFRKKYGAEMPTLTLARIMYKKNVEMFKNVEDARQALKYIEGKNGKSDVKKVINTEFYRPEHRPKNPYVLPESWSIKKPIFKLPITCNKIGFMSDFQSPFHDVKSIQAFIDWLKQKKINTLFLNGDIVDNYALSSFIKDPRKRNFKAELDTARGIFAWLRGEFPDIPIYYNMDANHELRWEKWLREKAPELLDMHEFELDVVLRLNEHKIIPLKNNKMVMIGKLPVLHGHTLFGKFGAGVNKAANVFRKTLRSCIASHVHVTDEFTKRDLSGKMITCWTTGCFMDIDAVEYNEHNDYNHGGSYIETDNDGNYTVENKRMYNYKIL